MSFTGFFVSLKGHMVRINKALYICDGLAKVNADIYLRRAGVKARIIARSSARTDEDGVFGPYCHCLHQ